MTISAGINNLRGNVSLIRKSYKDTVGMGPGVSGADFRMKIAEYPKLEFLVQTTQIPELKREVIEAKGPLGVEFIQYGRPLNSGQIAISFKEVISGACYAAIRDAVLNQKYLSITLSLIPEENAQPVKANTVDLKDCLIELEATDLSVEDGAYIVKPSGTIRYSWLSWYDEDSQGGQNIETGTNSSGTTSNGYGSYQLSA